MKRQIFILLFFPFSLLGYSKQITVSGTIKDASTGEDLIGATVFDPNNNSGTTSNSYGFYSMTLEQGSHRLQFQFIGYAPQVIEVSLDAERTLNIELSPLAESIDEVVVTAKGKDSNVSQTGMGITKLDPKQLETILKLSKLMRYLLYETEKQLTTINKEIKHLKGYVELMQIRVPTNVKVIFLGIGTTSRPVYESTPVVHCQSRQG